MAIRRMRLALSLLCVLMTIGTGTASDEPALLALKAGLSGSISSALASWNTSASFCGWEGVTCSRRWPTRVAALDLPSSNLTGTLPPAVGNLTFLRRLNLSSNQLHGEIPPAVGRLRRLLVLDMDHNSFSGAIPANLSSCISLTILRIQSNPQLGGRIPPELGNTLPRLEKLQLRKNSLTGKIPASLANLSSLQLLSLSYNKLEGLIPPGLGDIAGLRYLFLNANNLSGELPISLYNLSSLVMLQVGNNMLHGSIPSDIGRMLPGIQVFGLNVNRFTGVIPPSLSNLSTLTDLYLSDNKFTGFVPPNLGRLQYLQHLYLVGNQLEADNTKGWEFLTSLSNCSQLQVFVLANNSFSGQLPRPIGNLSTTLRMLNLENNNISGSIPEDIGNLVGLSFLDLGFNSILSGVIPESIGKLTNLVEISLYNTSLSGLIPASIGNLTNLNRIYAFYCNLEGPIPPSIGDLKKLFVLDLSYNHLNGSIPKDIFELQSLSWFLDLSYNSLSGPLPSEVGSLVNLNGMDLSGNQLSGQIPDSIGNCEVMEALYLEENSFEGGIPQSLSNLKGLTVLNLTMNKLSGRIPDTIARIPNLQQLFLAHNNFSGPIPATLQNLTTLWQLDVSFNKLQGEVPVKGVFRNLTFASVVGNNLCGGIPQLHLAPCPILNVSKNRNQHLKSLAIALPTTGAILVLVSAIVVILLHQRKFKQRQNRQATSLVIEEQYQRVSYYALSRGSNEFSEANLLGKGRYGSVFRCTLDDESALVAVKVFDLQQSGSSKSFEAECEALRRVRHRCLIKIITCCSSIGPQGQEFKALVFEFMPNGSLDGWIHPKSSNLTPSNTLSLSQRLNIAVDIFDALDYLHNHCQPPIIHCDLKPSNILLSEDKSAKVGDFGISRILPKSSTKTLQSSKSSIGIRGSIGYIAPEYGEGSTITRAGDTYSLGILLLEMFTGRSPTDDIFRDSMDLHKFVAASFLHQPLDIADPTIWLHEEENVADVKNESIKTRIIQQCLVSVLRLGISCSKQQPRERMMLAEAVSEMHATRDEYLRSWMVGHEEHSTVS
uniref:Receptor kinase-like protein Xa21 n=1 Tax=Oryza sativa subsp. japonica TaxID=39947 RepID=B9A1H1_ORYSJ|nr:putative LRR-kinase protein [Oryza sativa Japonica Group]BAH20869.1 putative LRR-kinase protein [Oryza sativa Japonica Group]